MKQISKNKAFTLIEVLIVTAIISLVASIVNAQMSEARKKADDAHMKTEVQQVRNAVEQYRQKTGHVPFNVGSYVSGNTYGPGKMAPENTEAYRDVMNELVEKGFMPEVPTSPNGQSYSYLATEDGGQAVFAATLNNDESSSNANNSCDVVDKQFSGWGSCSFVASYVAIDCSTVDYNSETQECFSLSSYYLKEVYCVVDYCGEDSVDVDLYPQSICDNHARNLSSPTNKICSYDNGYTICNKNFSDTVCSGGSNSDYCSCI